MSNKRKTTSEPGMNSSIKKQKGSDILKNEYYYEYLNLKKLECIKDCLPLNVLRYAAAGLGIDRLVETDRRDELLQKDHDHLSENDNEHTKTVSNASKINHSTEKSYKPKYIKLDENFFSSKCDESLLNESKINSLEELTPTTNDQRNTFSYSETSRIVETEQYKKLVQLSKDTEVFYSNKLPPMKDLQECKANLSKLSESFENKIKMIFDIKETSNFKDLKFYDDDDPLCLEIYPMESKYNPSQYKLFSREWFEEVSKELSSNIKESERFEEDQKQQIIAYQKAREEKWREKIASDEDLNLSDDLLKALNIQKKLKLPDFTMEMERVIERVLAPRSMCDVVAEKSPLYQILYKDIETLCGLNWLNDEIINAYLSLIKERSNRDGYPSVYVFNTFFYPKMKTNGHAGVKRWTRRDDIFSYDINLVPLHLGMHWCLGVIDYRIKKVQYYDSLGMQDFATVVLLKNYLICEYRDKKQQEFDTTGWIFEEKKDIPLQQNSSDCGMFTLKYAEYVTRNAKINFSQEHMPYFRRMMIYELVTGEIV